MNGILTPAQSHTHYRLQHELPFYAKQVLKIRDKLGALLPFGFNKVQLYVHQRLQAQIKSRGFVRAILVKGRKQGCSTYVAGRYYHKATMQDGRTVFILSHEAKTTDTLFTMVNRFYDNSPEFMRPLTDKHNTNQMVFSGLDSNYTVGTAGNATVGRGGTPLLFHGSEVAFWEKTDDIRSGIINSVPRSKGTEIILESTANGQKGMFYTMSMDALKKKGDYELIFIPWFWQLEYRASPNTATGDEPFTLEEEDLELKYLYGLDNEQLYWRKLKIIELGSLKMFKQEYPCNVMEAFQASGDSLMELEDILRARKSTVTDPMAPLILGVDPAHKGDRTALVLRQGRQILWFRTYAKMEAMQLAGVVGELINKHDIDMTFIDMGLGYGTVGRLHELGYKSKVIGVYFGGGANRNDIYQNKRAEMFCEFGDWIKGEVNIPDDDAFQMDLRMIPDFTLNSTRKRTFMKKEDIKLQNGGISSDIFDAGALTFAQPVRASKVTGQRYIPRGTQNYNTSPLGTLNRIRGRNKRRM